MELKTYNSHGRRLLVEFNCYRCKETAIKPLETCIDEVNKEGGYRDLYNLRPPKDWQDGGFYYPLFCPKCAAEYKKFMNNEGADNG